MAVQFRASASNSGRRVVLLESAQHPTGPVDDGGRALVFSLFFEEGVIGPGSGEQPRQGAGAFRPVA